MTKRNILFSVSLLFLILGYMIVRATWMMFRPPIVQKVHPTLNVDNFCTIYPMIRVLELTTPYTPPTQNDGLQSRLRKYNGRNVATK